MSLLEGSLSGVEALRHLRLDLQARKKVLCQFGSKLMVVRGLKGYRSLFWVNFVLKSLVLGA